MEALVIWNCRRPVPRGPARAPRAGACPGRARRRRSASIRPTARGSSRGPYPAGRRRRTRPDVAPPAYDPGRGRAAAGRGGLEGLGRGRRSGARPGRRASIELLYPDGPADLRATSSRSCASAYEKVGVELVLRPLDWAAFSERGDAGEFEAQLTGRALLAAQPRSVSVLPLEPVPAERRERRLLPEPGGGPRSWRRRAGELDPAKRLELYRQVHRLLAADPPADFLWGADQYWAISKRIEDVEVSPLGPLPLPAGAARLAGPRAAAR